MRSYAEFIASKRRDWTGVGIDVDESALPSGLFPFQSRLVQWALRKGRAALWADTGLGKTMMQCAWANAVDGRVLILAPLCVSSQTIREAAKIGVEVGPFQSGARIETVNYEKMHHVIPSNYSAVVLDESSILKAFDGKTRTRLIDAWRDTPMRLCCTATPAPNDIAELANHCEFLGIMTRAEMLATFFVHDEDGWRLKRHATSEFYRWLASWGLFLRRPSDLGFDDNGYLLPPLRINDEIVESEDGPSGGLLFASIGKGITGRNAARRSSLDARVGRAANLARQPGQWLIWCGLNAEQDAVSSELGDECVSVQGADDEDYKRESIERFLSGDARVLVTKPKIAGFGMNFQHCHQMIFLGLGDSYETYYQAIRRCYRFGQTEPVDVHVVVSHAETIVVDNVRRKEDEASKMARMLIEQMAEAEKQEIGMTERQREDYKRTESAGDSWRMVNGDCVEEMERMDPESVGLSVYSPPFSSLYTYSNSERDIGNCSTRAEFMEHLGHSIRGLLRITKPGRLTCCHIAQVTSTKATHGVIGMIDLRGAVIEAYVANGWIYHGEVCIDKDPQAQAIRTKSKSLLFVQLRKDASWLRPALADYILVFRKPGENTEAVKPDITNEDWIQWARPIWYGIRESDTLNVHEARGDKDERHICPLQLGTIERCVRLWSNPGDLVFSPFGGIGSEGYVSVLHDRRYYGVELKREYYECALRNLKSAERKAKSGTLFSSCGSSSETTSEPLPTDGDSIADGSSVAAG